MPMATIEWSHLQYHLKTGRAAHAAYASAPVHHIARYVIVRAAHQTAAAAARRITLMLVRMHGMRLMDMDQLLMVLQVLMLVRLLRLLMVMQVMLMEYRTGGHGSMG